MESLLFYVGIKAYEAYLRKLSMYYDAYCSGLQEPSPRKKGEADMPPELDGAAAERILTWGEKEEWEKSHS